MADSTRRPSADERARQQHADGGTTRPEHLEAEGRVPLPEEITGRASGTDEDLVALFDNDTEKHLTDGFRGGSEDEPPVDDDDPSQTGL